MKLDKIHCSKCNCDKPMDEFYAQAKAPLGKMSWCKSCHKEHVTKVRKTPKGRKRQREINRKSRRNQERSSFRNDPLKKAKRLARSGGSTSVAIKGVFEILDVSTAESTTPSDPSGNDHGV